MIDFKKRGIRERRWFFNDPCTRCGTYWIDGPMSYLAGEYLCGDCHNEKYRRILKRLKLVK